MWTYLGQDRWSQTKTIYIAAYYRPKEGDTESISELRRSLDMAAQLKGTLWLLGTNYPKFTWNHEHVMSMKSRTGFSTNYEDFVSLLDDFSLVQMLSEPTRGENVLDFFLTSNHSLVNDIKVSPSIADHSIVVVNVNVKLRLISKYPTKSLCSGKQTGQTFDPTWLKRKLKFWIIINSRVLKKSGLLLKLPSISGISQFIPIKKIGPKKSLPWIT